MAKKKAAAATAPAAAAPVAEQPKAPAGNGAKKPMGRQIANLKAKAREALPADAPADALAAKGNELAEQDGFLPVLNAGHFTEQPKKGGKAAKRKPAVSAPAAAAAPAAPANGAKPSGFMGQLQAAVALLGKDGVKKLVDSL